MQIIGLSVSLFLSIYFQSLWRLVPISSILSILWRVRIALVLFVSLFSYIFQAFCLFVYFFVYFFGGVVSLGSIGYYIKYELTES